MRALASFHEKQSKFLLPWGAGSRNVDRSVFVLLREEPDSPLLAMKWAQAGVRSSSYEFTVRAFVVQLSFSLPFW